MAYSTFPQRAYFTNQEHLQLCNFHVGQLRGLDMLQQHDTPHRKKQRTSTKHRTARSKLSYVYC